MQHDAKTPAVSVLVPIYNVEKYLRECLDSLVGQTFSDFEAILINDGSTDGSRQIIGEYLDADERFRVIDKPNSGYGSSMNRGLDEARGTYVAILESDDFFEPYALERLHAAATATNADAVKANFWLYWSVPKERNIEFDVVLKHMEGKTVTPSDVIDKIIFYAKPSIWSGLYRRDFLVANDIRFLETPGASYQDAGFNFKVWAMADRATYLPDHILHYRQDNEASSVNNPGKVFCVCDEYDEMDRYLRARPKKDALLRGVLTRMKFDSYMWNMCRLSPELRQEFLSRVREELAADRAAGNFEDADMGIYKETDLAFLLDRYDDFVRGIPTYGGGSLLKNLRHYLIMGGPALVWNMVATVYGRRRAHA